MMGKRLRAALALIVCSSTSAAAEPASAGASLGTADDHTNTVGLWARGAIQPRVALQLELARVTTSPGMPDIMARPGSADILQGGGLVVVDLGDSAAFVPIVLAGAGLDRATNIVRDATFAHAEVGLGVELRGRRFTLGADARIGTRELVAQTQRDVLVTFEPRTLDEGRYRTARLFAGLRF